MVHPSESMATRIQIQIITCECSTTMTFNFSAAFARIFTLICYHGQAEEPTRPQMDGFPQSPTSSRGSNSILDRQDPPIRRTDEWQLMLYNWLQDRYGTAKNLTWDVTHFETGEWEVIAYYKKIEYGRGKGSTKLDAAEQSAQQVLIALRGDYGNDLEQPSSHTGLAGRRSSFSKGDAAGQAPRLALVVPGDGDDNIIERQISYTGSSGSGGNHSKRLLNDWLQGLYGTTKHLTWEETQAGPNESDDWLVIAYVNEIEYGRGTSTSKDDAAEKAAQQVLVVLRGY